MHKLQRLCALILVLCLPFGPAWAQHWQEMPAQGSAPPLFYKVIKPATTGRAPVAIMLHGGGGMDADQTAAFNKWSAWLAERGVASVILDSYRGRGLQSFHYSGDMKSFRAMLTERANDARRILAWLRASDWADASRLFLFGQSQGASVASVMNFETPERAAVVAFYIGCDPKYFDNQPPPKNNPPSLWLLGESDTVTRAANCVTLHQQMAQRGGNADSIKVVVFPGAHHTFDWQAPMRMWGQNKLEYSKAADDGSRREIDAFLKQLGWVK